MNSQLYLFEEKKCLFHISASSNSRISFCFQLEDYFLPLYFSSPFHLQQGIITSHCLWTCSLSVWEKKCWSGFWDLLLNSKREIGIFLSPGETIDEKNPSEIKREFLVMSRSKKGKIRAVKFLGPPMLPLFKGYETHSTLYPLFSPFESIGP